MSNATPPRYAVETRGAADQSWFAVAHFYSVERALMVMRGEGLRSIDVRVMRPDGVRVAALIGSVTAVGIPRSGS